MPDSIFHELLGPALLALVIALVLWDRRRHSARSEAKDGPETEPYRVFTDEFDLVLTVGELPERLQAASPDRFKGWSDRDGQQWSSAAALAEELELTITDCDMLREKAQGLAAEIDRDDMVIILLVDQSGSLRGRSMAAVRAALAAVTEALVAAGLPFEMLGFSTVGWRGGKAYQRWMEKGRPKRPGRLCALLHILYKDAAEADWAFASRRAMMHPDILRENVDGEALRWAASRLDEHRAKHKFLLVISDGAPVDDATLMHNGPSYLYRDIVRAIAEIEQAGEIRLGAVGVGYDVSAFYRASITCEDIEPTALSTAMIEQLVALGAMKSAGGSTPK